MGMLTHALQQTWEKVEDTLNFDGDQVGSVVGTLPCRFRYITQLDRTNSAESIDTSDAIVWFEPTADIAEGSIGRVDGSFWRVDSLVKARRLVGSNVMFLKAFVKRHQLATIS